MVIFYKKIIFLCLFLCCGVGFCQDAQYLYNSTGDAVSEMRKENKITRTQACEIMLDAAKTYFPNDDLLIGTWVNIVGWSKKLDKKEISEEVYEKLRKTAWDNFNVVAEERQYRQEQEIANARNTIATYNLLHGAGNAFRNSSNPVLPSPVVCNTRAGITTCY